MYGGTLRNLFFLNIFYYLAVSRPLPNAPHDPQHNLSLSWRRSHFSRIVRQPHQPRPLSVPNDKTGGRRTDAGLNGERIFEQYFCTITSTATTRTNPTNQHVLQ